MFNDARMMGRLGLSLRMGSVLATSGATPDEQSVFKTRPTMRRGFTRALRCSAPLLMAWVALPAFANNHAYVANCLDNTVSVVDMATNTVSATVPVGSNPLSIAVSPNGAAVYTANEGDNTVSVINAATNTVTATTPAPTR
ncbi:YncE family protein [Dyella monticola]|nr:YncE family protein [Dyella monticola]